MSLNQYSVSNHRYTPLLSCIPKVPVGPTRKWPSRWPERLTEQSSEESYSEDTRIWSGTVSEIYLNGLGINWTRIHNVMDMNAGYGG